MSSLEPIVPDAGLHALVDRRAVIDLTRFGQEAIKWMEEAELNHKKRLFYADEVEGGQTNLDIRRYAQNGRAKGFTARSKSFTLAEGWRPSQAIREFIGGDNTVCECEGLMHAVMYNALCDVLTPHLFDAMFPAIPIGVGFDKAVVSPTGRTILPLRKGVPRAYKPGDWVYILTGAMKEFHEAVQESKHGAAAGGWNLVYVGDGKFMGFGLSGGRVVSYTLDEIREKMVADVFDHPRGGEEEKKKSASPPPLKRRGSADFSRPGASSSPSPSSTREYVKNSIQVQFFRRLDVPVLTEWIRSLAPPRR